MNKEVLIITHEIMKLLSDNKSCEVKQLAIITDTHTSNKTNVTIKFSYYDDESKKVPEATKRDLKWHICADDCKGELNLAAFEGIENDPDYQEGE